jgi:hypothetical protein
MTDEKNRIEEQEELRDLDVPAQDTEGVKGGIVYNGHAGLGANAKAAIDGQSGHERTS